MRIAFAETIYVSWGISQWSFMTSKIASIIAGSISELQQMDL